MRDEIKTLGEFSDNWLNSKVKVSNTKPFETYNHFRATIEDFKSLEAMKTPSEKSKVATIIENIIHSDKVTNQLYADVESFDEENTD